MVITAKTNLDGSVTVFKDGVATVTHTAGSELANISKQFETKAGNTATYSGSNSSTPSPSPSVPSTPATNPTQINTIAQTNQDLTSNDGFINALYQEKYKRDATQAELDRFKGYSVRDATNIILGQELSPFSDKTKAVKSEEDIKKEEEEKIKAKEEEDKKTLEESYAIIDKAVELGQISPDTAFLYKTVVNNYKGVEVNFDEIINELNDIKEKVISPEYEQLVTEALADVTSSKNLIQERRKTALEEEQAVQKSELEQTQGAFETAGLSFSGEAGEVLGQKSALSPNKVNKDLGEGTLGAYQRRISSSSQAEFLNNLRNLTRTSEGLIGSDATSGLGLSEGLVGGQKGSLEKAKETDISSTLNTLFQNREKAQTLGATQLN